MFSTTLQQLALGLRGIALADPRRTPFDDVALAAADSVDGSDPFAVDEYGRMTIIPHPAQLPLFADGPEAPIAALRLVAAQAG